MSTRAYNDALAYLINDSIPQEIEEWEHQAEDGDPHAAAMATAYKRIAVQLEHGCGRNRKKRRPRRRMRRA